MELHVDDMTVRLIKTDTKSTEANDFRLLVDYVDVLKEIYDDTKLHEVSWNGRNINICKVKLT